MRGSGATHNLFAVSAALMEQGINQEQTIDLALMLAMEDVANLEVRRESNADEANGLEEPDLIYDNGATSGLSMNFKRAQPHQFAFLYAYALGQCVTTAAGSGHLHTITPISGSIDMARDLPSFTGLQRLGKTVLKRRLASLFVDQVSTSFSADDWVQLSGTIKGTGKFADNVIKESISAAGNAASLELAANGVEGATADERLDSIHRIRVLLSGVWTEVEYSAVSSATPAAITITAPSAEIDSVIYEVLYVPVEGAEWDFPAALPQSPLRVAEMQFTIGGSWDGTSFTGGRVVSTEVMKVSHSLSNSGSISFVPGGGGAYASVHERSQRSQKLSVDRKLRDYIMQQHIADNDTMGCRILCQGAEFDTGHNYQVEFIFPKLGVLSANMGVSNRKLTEAVELQVLEDADYGSVIVRVKEIRAAGYAQ